MGRTIKSLTLPCNHDGVCKNIIVRHHYRGTEKGTTSFEIEGNDGAVSNFSLLTTDDALSLAHFIESEINHPKPTPPAPTFKVTGHCLRIMSNGNLIKTFSSSEFKIDWDEYLNINSIRKALPQYASDDYYFVIYSYRDGISNENTDDIIDACLKYQEAMLISGDLNVCRPMTGVNIEEVTGIDNSIVSRAVKGARIYTCHRNYSLETGISSLDFPSLFNEGILTTDNRLISTIGIKVKINAIIETEDKSNPFTDDEIVIELKKYGYDIARKTVNKYRNQVLGIPNSNVRKIRK